MADPEEGADSCNIAGLRGTYVVSLNGFTTASHQPDPTASAAVLLDFHREQLLQLRSGYGPVIVTVGPAVLGLLTIRALMKVEY